MNDRSHPAPDGREQLIRDSLSEWRALVEAAVAFAEEWDDVYRQGIFQATLDHLLARHVTPVADERIPTRLEPPAHGSTDKNKLDSAPGDSIPIAKLAGAIGADVDLLRRVVHIGDEGEIEILGRIDGSSTRELQNRYGVVYAFIKEKALGVMEVDIEELRDVCTRHGCYDSSNFTRNFRKERRLRERKGSGGRGKTYIATKEGLNEAAAILREMTEG